MASSCSLGASHIKLPKLDFGRASCSDLQQRNTVRPWIGRSPLQYAGLAVSNQPGRAFNLCCSSSSETVSATNIASGSKENKSSGLTSQLIPNASEVEFLVTDICDSTSIAEFELKLGGFRLHVTRNLPSKTSELPPSPPPLPSPAATTANTTVEEAPGSNGSVSSLALAITKPNSLTGGIQSFVDKAADEGLMILQSPRVGFFRRSRTIKGKRAPPSCKEKQIVKEGQVLCYVEQLGGEIPIESDVSGEVVRILREDGEPVGYGDALIAVLPDFPGIKKLH